MRIKEKSFNHHKLSYNRITQNMCLADNLETHLTKGGPLDTNFEEMRFLGSLWRLTLCYTARKTYKISKRKIQQVDRELKLQVNQIIRIFKIKDGRGLFWSKLSDEIPHFGTHVLS